MHFAGADRRATSRRPTRTISRPSSSIVSNVPRSTSLAELDRDRRAEAGGALEPAARGSRQSRGPRPRAPPARPRPRASAVNSASAVTSAPQLGERCRRIGHARRRVAHVDADADHDVASCRPAASTASSRMPATFAPSKSTSFGHLRATRRRSPARHRAPCRARARARSRGSPLSSARPAAKPSVAECGLRLRLDEEQACREIAARRLPGPAAAAMAGRLLAARRPRAGRDRRRSPGRAPRCWSSRSSRRRRADSRRRAPSGRAQKPCSEETVRGGAGRLDQRRGDQDEGEHQDAGDAEHRASSAGSGSNGPPARRNT